MKASNLFVVFAVSATAMTGAFMGIALVAGLPAKIALGMVVPLGMWFGGWVALDRLHGETA